MTPTLIGRWQSRLLLFSTVGALITLIFGSLYDDFATVFALLFYVLIIGLGWDVIYRLLAYTRWDADWPPVLVLATGIWEGIFVWIILQTIDLPLLPDEISLGKFVAHYGTVFMVMFIGMFSYIRLFLPKWRYTGGRIGYGLQVWVTLLGLTALTVILPAIITN